MKNRWNDAFIMLLCTCQLHEVFGQSSTPTPVETTLLVIGTTPTPAGEVIGATLPGGTITPPTPGAVVGDIGPVGSTEPPGVVRTTTTTETPIFVGDPISPPESSCNKKAFRIVPGGSGVPTLVEQQVPVECRMATLGNACIILSTCSCPFLGFSEDVPLFRCEVNGTNIIGTPTREEVAPFIDAHIEPTSDTNHTTGTHSESRKSLWIKKLRKLDQKSRKSVITAALDKLSEQMKDVFKSLVPGRKNATWMDTLKGSVGLLKTPFSQMNMINNQTPTGNNTWKVMFSRALDKLKQLTTKKAEHSN